jgi:hypothetical protein
VDVFIPLDWKTFHANRDQLGWQSPPQRVKMARYERSEACPVPSTARATARVQGAVVDIVFMDKPLDKAGVASFPVHAQRCVWSLERGLDMAPEAKVDIDNKTFTLDARFDTVEKQKSVAAKVGEWQKRPHYKDWKLVYPKTTEWWEK